MTVLSDIALIQLGYSFRGRVDSVPHGKYQVVQIKDVSQEDKPSFADLARVNLDNVKHDHILRQGDILFVSRGHRNRAVLIEKYLHNAIAGSQFLVLKPREEVLPEFLGWYLNQKPSQLYLEQNAVGSNVRLISKEVINRLPVALPALETQQRIVRIHELALKETSLVWAIEQKRSEIIDKMLLDALQNKRI
jgi:restriction endonuclease S subunit